mgnify:CR=1 FL=1
MNEQALTKEERVLAMMKNVLTSIAKDTVVARINNFCFFIFSLLFLK